MVENGGTDLNIAQIDIKSALSDRWPAWFVRAHVLAFFSAGLCRREWSYSGWWPRELTTGEPSLERASSVGELEHLVSTKLPKSGRDSLQRRTRFFGWDVATTKYIDHNCTSRLKRHSPFRQKYVDVMRQTRTSIDNASEHTVNDYRNKESADTLSERHGSTLCQPTSQKYMVDPQTYKTITRPDTIWPKVWARLPTEQQKDKIENWDEEATRLQYRR